MTTLYHTLTFGSSGAGETIGSLASGVKGAMADWKSYIDHFYRQSAEEQARLWSQLTPEQQTAFLAARNTAQAPAAPTEQSKMTLSEELDALIRTGNELLSVGSFSKMKRFQEYTAWRLRCLGALREIGQPAQHLLPTVENKFTQQFFKQFVQQILGAMVAARAIVARSKTVERIGTTLETTVESDPSVFVVHGHDHTALQQTARLIERLDLKPIILFEEPSKGRTIIEKLEQRSRASAALVILTPDDIGAPAAHPEVMRPRARQNVILELGYFLGILGRQRVIVLYTDGVELPSDYVGVEYIKLDAEGAWKLRVARELRAAGLEVDLNKLD